MNWLDQLESELAQRITDKVIPQAHQKPPESDDWEAWVLATGRGGGKTFAAMFWLAEQARSTPGLRVRVIAPTFADGVASCVEGPNGLLRFATTAKWAPSAAGGARVEFNNGSKVWIIGTPTPRDVDRLRALTNIHVDVFEEAAANPQLQEAWDQAKLSRRGIGIKTRWVATTTPRPLKIMRQWQADPDVHYVRAPSSANAHADKTWLASLDKIYKGTRLYRQEVLGEIVDDVDGALWTLADLERSEVNRTDVDLHKIVVGVDPPATVGTCGIVVAGLDEGGHLYVLADYSITDATPNRWARQVYRASNDYGGAAVVAEINQGGRMVTSVLKSAAEAGETPPPITTVHAAKGKQTRAEPVALRWEAEEQTAHMCPDPSDETRNLAKLYDQLTGWVPGEGDSPDRLDAMVWAGTHLRQSTFPSAVVATQVASSRLPGW